MVIERTGGSKEVTAFRTMVTWSHFKSERKGAIFSRPGLFSGFVS